tara:strand:+ start:2507 stop:4054 length:1548 start_codon:yes stop_codon:yes gene_type:complete
MAKEFPALVISTRSREYNSYDMLTRSKVVFEFLTKGKTHRQLDIDILSLDSSRSLGYQSMGILHYLGLVEGHKGFFIDSNIETVIDYFESIEIAKSSEILNHLNTYYNHLLRKNVTFIDYAELQSVYNKFKNYVENESKQPLKGFGSNHFLLNKEGYKNEVHKRANKVLDIGKWTKSQIGSTSILKKVIASIELENNNLVNWYRYKPVHTPLKDALLNDALVEKFEKLFYGFFCEDLEHNKFFSDLTSLIGKKYPIMAYFLFIKDKSRYMPIAPRIFDINLKTIGIKNLTLARQCSWKNYSEYNKILIGIQSFLNDELDDEISLLDAHSFAWMINDFSFDEEKLKDPAIIHQLRLNKSPKFNARKRNKNRSGNQQSGARDYNKINRSRANIGKLGELLVLRYEKKRLKNLGREDLSEKVEYLSPIDDNAGYDIKSFTENGNVKYIEVKTTKSGLQTEFFVSENQVNKSKELENYFIYRVYNYDTNLDSGDFYIFSGKIETYFDLHPIEYKAFPKT